MPVNRHLRVNEPVHLPETQSMVREYLQTSAGIKQMRLWIKRRTCYDNIAKGNFVAALGITKDLLENILQPTDTAFRAPPTAKETESVLLLTVLSKVNPAGHLFFTEFIHLGGVPALLDYIDRIHHNIPNSLLHRVTHTLSNVAWKLSDELCTAVADEINGRYKTLDNIVSLIAYEMFELEDNVETSPLVLQNLLLLVYNAIYHRKTSLSLKRRDILNVLDNVFMNERVEDKAEVCLGIVARIYKALFNIRNHEERFLAIDDILNSNVPLISRWVELIETSEKLCVKTVVLDLMLAIVRMGNRDHKGIIGASGIVTVSRSLLLLKDTILGNLTVNLIGYLVDADDSYGIILHLFGNSNLVPLIAEHINRAYGTANGAPRPPPPPPPSRAGSD